MNEDMMLTLSDDEGNEIELEFIDVVVYRNEEYAIFFPKDDDGTIILRIGDTTDSEEYSYEPVEDEKVLNEVFEIFRERYKDVYIFD